MLRALINRTNWIVLATFLGIWANIYAADDNKKKPGPGGRPSPVMVADAKLQLLAPVTWVSAAVISLNDARLATEVEGQLRQVAKVGTTVAENDVVARIDNTFIKIRIDELQAAVQRERARLQFLFQEVVRLEKLAKQNAAAQTRLEQTQSEREVAKNELEIANTRLRQAREELARHVVRAPFPGVIAERFMRPGERAGVGDEVVRLIDANDLEIQARAPLASINYITEGMILDVKTDVGKHVEATLRTIVPIGDARSRLLDLRLDFTGVNWRVGQPVRVALPTAVAKEVLAVPRDALVLRRDGSSIFKINQDGAAEKVSVEIGIAAGDYVEVKGDLNDGDRVVIRGGERLRPGQKVQIISEGNAS